MSARYKRTDICKVDIKRKIYNYYGKYEGVNYQIGFTDKIIYKLYTEYIELFMLNEGDSAKIIEHCCILNKWFNF